MHIISLFTFLDLTKGVDYVALKRFFQKAYL